MSIIKRIRNYLRGPMGPPGPMGPAGRDANEDVLELKIACLVSSFKSLEKDIRRVASDLSNHDDQVNGKLSVSRTAIDLLEKRTAKLEEDLTTEKRIADRLANKIANLECPSEPTAAERLQRQAQKQADEWNKKQFCEALTKLSPYSGAIGVIGGIGELARKVEGKIFENCPWCGILTEYKLETFKEGTSRLCKACLELLAKVERVASMCTMGPPSSPCHGCGNDLAGDESGCCGNCQHEKGQKQ